ncbi:MAG: serine/threonine protein kinase [bacterium]|nr:serine/threonine protein kinase [bacterium]
MVPGKHEQDAEEASEEARPVDEPAQEPAQEPEGAAEGERVEGESAPAAVETPSKVFAGFPRIEGYRVEGYLGRGATGVVYSAVQLAVDRPVALKVLHSELVGSKRAVRRLQREARTAARLAHPSIISAIDMGETDGRWWYAMELVEGISLAERVQERGTLGEREALRLFIPLCDALQHAHQGGVVHRDIKPGNILIDMHGNARLVDLGLAFAEDDPMLTKPGGTLGTPHFISPEQAIDSTRADVRSDIWSLGATLFQSLTGKPPFEGASVAEILSGVLHERIPDPRQLRPELSKGMALVIRKCLTREPGRRYQEPVELARDLERIRERRSPEVRASALDPVRSTERAERLRRAALAAGGLVIAAGLVLLWAKPWRSDSGQESFSRWEALEDMRARFAGGELSHARALRALALLDPSGPYAERRGAAAASFEAEVRSALGSELGEVTADLELEFEEALEARNFAAARALLTGGMNRELLARTGFGSLPALPDPALGRSLETWRSGRREQLGRVRAAVVDEASRVLKAHYKSTVRGPLLEHLDENRWRSARALLTADRRVWLEASRADVTGLGTVQVAEILAVLDAELREDEQRLEHSWEVVEGKLRSFVRTTEDALLARIPELERDIPQKLEESFESELEKRKVDAEQILPEWDWGSRREMEAARARLVAAEVEEQERAAQFGFARDEGHAERLCQQRDYSAAANLWNRALKDPWRESMRVAMELRERECRLLEDLIRRAANGVRDRHKQSFAPRFSGIEHEGEVRAGADPDRLGFELLRRGGLSAERLFLRRPAAARRDHGSRRSPEASGLVLEAPDIELLAALDEHDPEDRLLQALFRYYEGDYEGARLALPLGRLADDSLLADLRGRVEAALDERGTEARARRRRLDALIIYVRRNVELDLGNTPMRIRRDIEEIREEFDDLLTLADRHFLDKQEAALTVQAASIDDVYAPDGKRESGPLDVTLEWTFAEGTAGAWIVGEPWMVSAGELWLSEAIVADEDLLSDAHAVRLPLRAPLDLDRKLTLRLEFAEVGESGTRSLENDVFVSFGGYHFLFHDDPAGPRMLVEDKLGPTDLLTLARADKQRKRGAVFGGFRPNEPHVLELSVWRQQKNIVGVTLDGKDLGRFPGRVSDEEADFVLRSQMPLRVTRVVLEGKKLRKPR